MMNLLERLDLQKYYPKKYAHGGMCVFSNAYEKPKHRTCPLFFLQKLIMVDYEARYASVQSENRCHETMNNNANSNYENMHDDTLSRGEGLATNTQTHIHPGGFADDNFYHCGDNFAGQYPYTKLFASVALPLLVPNPRSPEIELFWAFRRINKNWKCRDISTETQRAKTCAIVNAETRLVSFITFGESPSSKSQILNSLLSKQRHGVFFHRHCKGSSANGLLMGVTEVAWYCPGARDDGVFNGCISFANLHGDARRHRKQQLLHEISSINVILMSDGDHNDGAKIILQERLTSPEPFVRLCADRERRVNIAVKNRSEADFIDELKSTLSSLLPDITQTTNLGFCSDIARQYGFTVDEDHGHCEEGKSVADVLLSRLKDKPLYCMKDTFLPLQGKGTTGARKTKELTRFRLQVNQSIEEYRDKISEKQSIRKSQLLKAFPLNDVMGSLIGILQHQSDTVKKKYFLHWLKINVEKPSAECLSKLNMQYQQAWTRSIKPNETESSLLANRQNEYVFKFVPLLFGIDHLVGEVGQIYEASQTVDGADKQSAALPSVAADLMVSGFPISWTRDASHVPLSWISSVLKNVIEIIGDTKLFVLSILGIQSSGKSTLLNAMFGLQFPCGCWEMLGFDFVLIVDHRRAPSPPELSNATTQDNELAAFVIGLGNATAINIFENPSEMQDILQIAVQAFLRMKRVKFRTCVFVHQNVGDVTAQANTMEGRRRLKEKLDKTRLAAQREQCDVDSFDEVIGCDVASRLHYFAHLWGNPPMAPPNPSYCQNVQDLKQMLLDIAKQERNVLKMSELDARVRDLWTALLAESFVFSFKNTLEIAAYSKLEEMCVKWTWSLRSHLVQVENKQHTILNNSTDTTYDLTPSSVEQMVFPKCNEISRKIETYFNSDDTELLSQWKANFVKRFETMKDELVNHTYKKCTDLMKQKSARIKLDQNRSRYENYRTER
uniref:VLIG-type G domain-containing protein n=1 Tax=Petromyzon marinus TaxID=7757 RepID=S4RHS4_PETMA